MNEKVVDYDKNDYIQVEKVNEKKYTTTEKSKNGTLSQFFHKLNSTRFPKIKGAKIVIPIILLCVVVLALITYNTTTKSVQATNNSSNTSYSYTSNTMYIDALENKMKTVLGAINGAGTVNVMISIESGPEIKLANTVEEKTTTTSSGSVVTVVTTPIIISSDGEDTPVVLMEIVPKIKGVVVVSSGASNVRVKLDMINAIKALLNISSDRIEVFS